MSSQTNVLIVGAGPAGLTLALSLLQNNVPIRIIDRLTEYHGGARGTTLQPRMQELMAALGVLDDIRAKSTPPLQMRAYAPPDGKVAIKTWDWAETLQPDPSVPFLGPISCSQAVFESALRAKVESLGGKVELGVELVGMKELPEHVEASVIVHGQGSSTKDTISANWVVGTDGARGSVRKLTGISFLGETREGELSLAANVEVTGVDEEYWHMWGSFATSAVGLKPLGVPHVFQLQTGGPEANVSAIHDLESVKAQFARISGNSDIVIKDASWISEYKPQIRMADTFQHGRIFIAGDAAHCHPPTGGQGLNTSIMDSLNLSWKLALVIKGLSPVGLLETYDSERLPVVATMLDLAAKIHIQTFSAKSGVTKENGASWGKEVMWRPRNLLMLGVNYRWSPIVLDDRNLSETPEDNNPYEATGALRAGDRVPNAPGLVDEGIENTLFDMLSPAHHNLIVFRGSTPLAIPAIISQYEARGILKMITVSLDSDLSEPLSSGKTRVVLDQKGHAHTAFGVAPGHASIVVIRPDMFIGACVQTFENVEKYFSNILSD